jgi:hypothetical protein
VVDGQVLGECVFLVLPPDGIHVLEGAAVARVPRLTSVSSH